MVFHFLAIIDRSQVKIGANRATRSLPPLPAFGPVWKTRFLVIFPSSAGGYYGHKSGFAFSNVKGNLLSFSLFACKILVGKIFIRCSRLS